MHSKRDSSASRQARWARGAAMLPLLLIFFAAEAKPQDNPGGPWEVGGQLTALTFTLPSSKTLGFGGRLSRDFGEHLGLEVEANHFPKFPGTPVAAGETQVVAGAKAGFHLGRCGLFLKVRPGLVHFPNPISETSSRSTWAASRN
jgi:hypothetical protein